MGQFFRQIKISSIHLTPNYKQILLRKCHFKPVQSDPNLPHIYDQGEEFYRSSMCTLFFIIILLLFIKRHTLIVHPDSFRRPSMCSAPLPMKAPWYWIGTCTLASTTPTNISHFYIGYITYFTSENIHLQNFAFNPVICIYFIWRSIAIYEGL